MRAMSGAAILLALTGAVPVVPAAAQTSELSVEVGGSRVAPPSEVEGGATGFVVAGLRASRLGLGGSGGWASLLVGRALNDEAGGDFVSGEVGGALWRGLGGGFSAGLEGRAFAFRVADPFGYRAGAVEGTGTLRYRHGAVDARVAGVGGAGRSKVTVSTVVQRLRRRATVVEVLEDDLWRAGGTAEVLLGGAPVAAGVAAGVHRSAGGTYRSAGLRLVAGGLQGALEARLDAWSTPDGGRTTGGIAFYVPWGGWRARGVVGRPEPDPLLLAEPGGGSEGLLLGRRIVGREVGGRPQNALWAFENGRAADAAGTSGARIRFRVEPPATARTVAVLGDFTLWEPVAMAADGSRWSVVLEVPPGTHHFGFLVDGTWYLPDDAPDAVPDEWGRRSATLVVEGGAGS